VFIHNVDSSSEDERSRMVRLEPRFQANPNDFRVEISEFEGKLDPEEFLDWLCTVKRVFEYMDLPEDKKLKFMALRLRKYTSVWWTNICAKWVRQRKFIIRT